MKTARCIPIKAKSRAELRALLRAVSSCKPRPDLIEIWLDAMENDELIAVGRLIEKTIEKTIKKTGANAHIPIIVTDKSVRTAHIPRTVDEKIARFDMLLSHIKTTARIKNIIYAIDLDDTASPRAIQELRALIRRTGHRAKIILSHHDLNKTPSSATIKRRIEMIKQKGADMAKIVTTYKKPSDIITLIEAAARNKTIPTIFHLGGVGPRAKFHQDAKAARIICAAAGSRISYVALDNRHTTAPGQWTIAEWDRIVRTQPTGT